jgi:hypothetical protein
VAELGNLSAGILLSLRRMSTVKIRAGSLFRTPVFRIGAGRAGSGLVGHVENVAEQLLASSNERPKRFSSLLHSPHRPCTACTQVS